MSVIMTLRVSGDPANLERLAAEKEGTITFWRKLEAGDDVGWE